MELWPRLKNLKQNDANELFTLIELCLTCPYGNAVCESFISYLRVVKTDWRNRLNESNLTDLLRIKVTGPSLKVFNEEYCDLAVTLWNSEKRRRPRQRKRKAYRKSITGVKKTREMERNEYLKNWLLDVGVEDQSDCESDSNSIVCSDLIQEQQENVMSDSEDQASIEQSPTEFESSIEDDPLEGGLKSSTEPDSD